MEARSFRIARPGWALYVSMTVLFLVMLVPLVAIGTGYYNKNFEKSQADFWVRAVGEIIIIVVLILPVYILNAANRGQFVVDGEGLRMRGFLYGRKISRQDIDITAIERIDFRQQKEYKPIMRTNGIGGLPGYTEGWMRLRDWKKTLVFITDKSKVVRIGTRKNFAVFLSVEGPEEFIKAAKQIWENH